MQVGLKKEPDLPDVPLMLELAASDEDRQVLELMSSGSQIGRALFAPPGVPAERIAALRAAFDAMVKDPEFIAAAAKRKLDRRARAWHRGAGDHPAGGVVSAGCDRARPRAVGDQELIKS